MEIGLVNSVDINHQMQQAYLDYAMSVIVARALPDARDGLKPVHRRILYGMYDMGLRADSSYKKSARIVGEVLGKYHPHGDMAVYEAMARMAQDFSMRYLLVDGQGNFGSVDGDPPAAMRYTEARLTAPSLHLLADIGKNTVDFSDNFDASLQEPDVLPAAIPNLLVNGATGIAVGMSTNIPPHNLGEVVDALKYMLANWQKLDDINVEDLMRFIQGPDFPTGGLIIQNPGDEEGLTSAYGAGRGRVIVQSRVHIEEMERGRSRLIVSELPYMVNKSSLIERIAELAREGRLEGVADLRDESDRHGLRVVIELSKTAQPEKVLQELFKSTPMRTTFGIIMLALVDGEPRHLSLKQALRVYIEHRLVVIRRRAEYDLEKARQRAHILEGYLIALKNLDEVIELIKKSPDADAARTRLIKRFRLSDLQAQAILDMQLRRLAALERKKIEEEYRELQAQIKALETLLKSPQKMRDLCAEELQAVKEAYGDRRRTFIMGTQQAAAALTTTDLAPDHSVWVSATADGLVSRTLEDKPPKTSGRDAPGWLLRANTRDTLYLVCETGEAAALPVHALPEAEAPSAGAPLHKVSPFAEGEKLAALFALPPKDERPEGFIFTATRQGMVKKSALGDLPGPSAHTFTLVKVNDGDTLGWACITDGKADILLATADGMSIRFPETEVRPMGLIAAGVGGVKLGERDALVGMHLLPPKGEVLLVSSDGKAKRCAAALFPRQGRYGQGVVAWKLPRTATLAGVAVGKPSTRVTMFLDKLAPKAMRLDEAPLQTRAANGKPVVEAKGGVKVLAVVAWDALAAGRSAAEEDGAEGKRDRRPLTADRQAAGEQLKFDILEPANPTKKRTAKEAAKKVAPAKPSTSRRTAPSAAKTRPAVKKPAAKPTTTTKSSPKKQSKDAARPSTEKKPAAESKTTASAQKPAGKPAAGKIPAPAKKPSPTAAKPAPKKSPAKKPQKAAG